MSIDAVDSVVPDEVTIIEDNPTLVGAFGGDWMSEQLPGVLASDPFLQRLLRIFEDVANTVRWPADHLEHYVSAALAPLEFVSWLGKWLNLEIDTSWSEERQRNFVRDAGPLFVDRGTVRGLKGFLEAATNAQSEIVVEDTGSVHIRQDWSATSMVTEVTRGEVRIMMHRSDIDTRDKVDEVNRLIRLLVPADTIYTLEITEEEGS